jgi:hypothetical protein
MGKSNYAENGGVRGITGIGIDVGAGSLAFSVMVDNAAHAARSINELAAERSLPFVSYPTGSGSIYGFKLRYPRLGMYRGGEIINVAVQRTMSVLIKSLLGVHHEFGDLVVLSIENLANINYVAFTYDILLASIMVRARLICPSVTVTMGWLPVRGMVLGAGEVIVAIVGPEYSSMVCSRCNVFLVNPRPKRIRCINRGLTTNDDVNASINVNKRGIEVVLRCMGW